MAAIGWHEAQTRQQLAITNGQHGIAGGAQHAITNGQPLAIIDGPMTAGRDDDEDDDDFQDPH